ncbi:MAG: hypothetical protein IT436_11815 [Phycisphaerales bacterium]|nr:hypothetical protein [Phycisphaerales bacterium]
MNRATLALLTMSLATSLPASMAAAQATVEYLPAGFLITDLSANGSAGAGNVVGDGSYETFRWTRLGGVERLGRATVPELGIGAGSPDISYDGSRISASILSSDFNMTQGIWDVMTGWQETMPPMPPDGRIIDRDYGSAWGLSGDGSTVVGFYWSTDRARPSKWSEATGMIGLPKTAGRSARINAANFDGSIVGGWEERPTGPWQPTIWRGLTKHTLDPIEGHSGVQSISADGSVAVGGAMDPVLATRAAAIWRWDGTTYVPQLVGFLPGTVLTMGQAYFTSISDDAQLAVGSNIYTTSPGGPRDGIVWTPAGGLMKDNDYLASIGITLPESMDVVELTAVSADGSTITGIAIDVDAFEYVTFLVHLAAPCRADLNGDGLVDFADYLEFLNFYDAGDLTVDFTGDGLVDFADYLEFLNLYDAGC